ncbi:MAG: CTP synthase [Candidatus Kerfeldbacteria bacterium RIFCSPHIGHO2_02_FULL_42_14]|uniref:CTP synthase n=1 Tax=Candidatus Kerfeldbacteria bacterium RIFCSPHIGHO2_02_FULL_42_14 TaxID=1798540 RepID=A0A1G2AVA6_9BACT|nr:MAG: CTP synthase [Candidatus Kerfeldbacteria bacterium RIFCSPHIGHO2_02_FULL_42_14]OGY82324.1 MAG: CTP synthase [Candidatus Kerfeldbacteria bacterium RIFCSPHIGHO2_12_FULL_42_13]OGY84753.1 MAG: CTP synthase [Candidatus Kerfeldbacteria bacterium RIFCSPLOWO2_02_FULL_42_19]OGY85976.1 MAG: CTP synthase [Candidatus Kerfeldbacteria bacterium RIFCSPLOWO2_12_FULL_43_9]
MHKKYQRPKYIFVVGGVMSSVGKGVTTASAGALLKDFGVSVTAMKIDPYINVDAGTMNPTEHGEVFVTYDGYETDQDLGNYERFLDEQIPSVNYMTTGLVYQTVIERERNLGYHGKCVEVVPHIPLEVIRRIEFAQARIRSAVTIIEVGGTVGEYQNILFLEAARMMKLKYPRDVVFIMVSYLPIPRTVGEMKTKPTQHAVRTLNAAGIHADFIVCRSEKELDAKRKEKLALLCNLQNEGDTISAPDVPSVYQIPLLLAQEGFGEKLLKRLSLKKRHKGDLRQWRTLYRILSSVTKPVKIAVVGKYFGTGKFTLADSYISVIEALKHACWFHKRKPDLTWIDSEEYERNPRKVRELASFDGILVPGGFGTRGVAGLLRAIRFAREHKIPYFGLCYGMQLACIEIARNVLGWKDAHTTEIDSKTSHPIIHLNPFQAQNVRSRRFGGTMRLGSYDCQLLKGTKAWIAYRRQQISERHRHRYEFNNAYRESFEKVGLIFSGMNPETGLVEIAELAVHPWFLGTQFHPEFQSRPFRPHPLFREFINAAIQKR